MEADPYWELGHDSGNDDDYLYFKWLEENGVDIGPGSPIREAADKRIAKREGRSRE